MPAANPGKGRGAVGGGKKAKDQQNRAVTEQLIRRAREAHADGDCAQASAAPAASPFGRFKVGNASPFSDKRAAWLNSPPARSSEQPLPGCSAARDEAALKPLALADAPTPPRPGATSVAKEEECAVVHTRRRAALSSGAAARYNSLLQDASKHAGAVSAALLSHAQLAPPSGTGCRGDGDGEDGNGPPLYSDRGMGDAPLARRRVLAGAEMALRCGRHLWRRRMCSRRCLLVEEEVPEFAVSRGCVKKDDL